MQTQMRDEKDVQHISWLTRDRLIVSLCLFVSLCINAFYAMKVPDRLVLLKLPSGQVVVLDNRQYGETENVALSADRLSESDKILSATTLAEKLHWYVPKTVGAQFQSATNMMAPGTAAKYVEFLKSKRVVERKIERSYESTWKVTNVWHTPGDEVVRVQGEATERFLENGTFREVKQTYNLEVTLLPDPGGKRKETGNLGWMVAKFSDQPDAQKYTDQTGETVIVGGTDDSVQSEQGKN